jgi:hypothetical protein
MPPATFHATLRPGSGLSLVPRLSPPLPVAYHFDIGSRCQIDIVLFWDDFHAFIEFCYHWRRIFWFGCDQNGPI